MEEYRYFMSNIKSLDYDNMFDVRLKTWVFTRSKKSIWKKRRR